MIAKLPIIGSAVSVRDIAAALFPVGKVEARREFIGFMAELSGSRRVYLTDSGITAFYLILKGLQELSGATEVILPAYTAGSLVTAVTQAGLKPVLCDVSLNDFNMDTGQLVSLVSSSTLAITCVHMFGIGMAGIAQIKERFPKVFVIEDCAQALGTTIAGGRAGTFGDISFFSFNRGKNVPLLRGGCIAAHTETTARVIERQTRSLVVPRFGLAPAGNALAFTIATQPPVYGALYPVIRHFKETRPPAQIVPRGMGDFDVKLGMRVIARTGRLFCARYEAGMFLLNGLRGIRGLQLPVARPADRCVFNRLPVLFKDPAMVSVMEKCLWNAGIESSRMYLRPLHQMFDLGYAQQDFANARALAAGLLTLPCHPGAAGRLEEMIEVMRECR